MDRELIIRLIEQDIKHNQLINGFNNIGLIVSEDHHLNIVGIVSDLMGKTSDDWFDHYHKTMLDVKPNMTSKERISASEKLFNDLSIKN
ncbi:MAG: hypothetical protein R2799_02925 [Crocinitomicaceae bacterium]